MDRALLSWYKLLNLELQKSNFCVLNFQLEKPSNLNDCRTQLQDTADIETGPVNNAEIRRVIKSLKNGKAPGEDMITAELLKADLEFTTDREKELTNTIWSLKKVPLKWKRGIIIKIPKKGSLRTGGE